MNKRYLLPGLFFGSLTFVASAQRVDQLARPQVQLAPSAAGAHQPDASVLRGGGEVVWSEDFANGFAGNNPSGPWTTSGVNGNIWAINSNAPRGGYTNANERITSTTVLNGFAKFASDSANSSWSNGTPTALPAAQFVDWDGSLESPVIDLSLTPQVELVYEQRSRWCCGDSPFQLEISTDGGASWPTVFLANDGLPINQGAPGTGTTSAVTETRRFSLSTAIAANPSNVRFRFHHNGEAGTSHYYWQLDDIRIEVLPDFEMRMNYAYTSTTGTGEEFGRIPASQLPSVMNIGAEVLNYGSATQTNVAVECVVRDEDDNIVFSQTTNVGELTTGVSAISDDFVNLPFLDLGRYEATFSIVSDQLQFDEVVEDNSLTRNFEVTSNVYSIDALGNHPPGVEQRAQLGTSSFTDNATLNVMSMYNIFAPTEALSATIVLGSNTRVGTGATIEVFLLDTADVLGQPSNVDSPIDGVGSELHTIVQADVVAGQVTIPFEQPVFLQPGAYYVCARISGSGTPGATDAEVFVADDNTVPQPGAASMIYLPIDFNDDGTEGPHLYSNGTASAIRLNVTPTVGVDENERQATVSMFPNPTNGQLNILSDVTGVMAVEVIDMLGATVHLGSFNGRTTIDLTGLASGVYTVRVSNGEQTSVERINLH